MQIGVDPFTKPLPPKYIRCVCVSPNHIIPGLFPREPWAWTNMTLTFFTQGLNRLKDALGIVSKIMWVFPKIGVPQNVENPIKMDDLGVPLF